MLRDLYTNSHHLGEEVERDTFMQCSQDMIGILRFNSDVVEAHLKCDCFSMYSCGCEQLDVKVLEAFAHPKYAFLMTDDVDVGIVGKGSCPE